MKTKKNRLGRVFVLMIAAGITLSVAIVVAGSSYSLRAAQAPPYLPLNVHVGEKPPDFGLLSADGQLVKLSQFAGKNVLLDFYEGYW